MVWSSLSGAIVSMGQRDSDHGFKENYGNFGNLKLKGEKGEEKKKSRCSIDCYRVTCHKSNVRHCLRSSVYKKKMVQ